MNADVIRFDFEPQVDLHDAESTLHLAMFALEGLLGRARVRLEADYWLDETLHGIAVDASHEVGAMLVRVFTGLLLREFGEDSFHIERLTPTPHHTEPERTVCA